MLKTPILNVVLPQDIGFCVDRASGIVCNQQAIYAVRPLPEDYTYQTYENGEFRTVKACAIYRGKYVQVLVLSICGDDLVWETKLREDVTVRSMN